MSRDCRLFFNVKMQLQPDEVPQTFKSVGEAFLAAITDRQRRDESLPPFQNAAPAAAQAGRTHAMVFLVFSEDTLVEYPSVHTFGYGVHTLLVGILLVPWESGCCSLLHSKAVSPLC